MIEVRFPIRVALNATMTEEDWIPLLDWVFRVSQMPEPPAWEHQSSLSEECARAIDPVMRLYQSILLDLRCPTYSLTFKHLTELSPASSRLLEGQLLIVAPPFTKSIPFQAIWEALQGVVGAYIDASFQPKAPECWAEIEVLSKLIRQVQQKFGLPETSLPFILNELCLRQARMERLDQSMFLVQGPKGLRYMMGSACDGDSVTGSMIAQNKLMTTSLLRRFKLPAPQSIGVSSLGHALKAAETLGYPVAVKPINLERSQGVTPKVETPEALEIAYQDAASFKRPVLVETHLPGECNRLVAVGGEFVFAVVRHPLSLTGDGESTLDSLYRKATQRTECLAPYKKRSEYPSQDEFEQALKASGLPRDHVLPERQLFRILPSLLAGRSYTAETVTDRVHPDNQTLVETIARLVRLSVCGIDLITEDVSVSWRDNGAGVCEINFKPEIGVNTARRYVDYLLR